jgi:hypothetical protein
MATKESLRAQLRDFDLKINLNFSDQGKILFHKDGPIGSALAMVALKFSMAHLHRDRTKVQAELLECETAATR